MASGLDLTTFDPMLKQHYAPGVVLNLAMARNKALGVMNKSHKKPGGGRSWTQPVQFGLPGGGSSDFATAMAATNNQSQYGVFTVPRTKHYRLARVDNETIESTADGDMDAFDNAFDEFDKAIQAEANYMNFRLFRSRGGSIGRMTNASFATAVITLDDPAAVWGVRKGDVLVLSSSDGTSGSLRAGTLTISSVQRAAGTITTTANISTGVAAATQNDYLFLAGDFGGACAGFIDWIPDAAPASTLYGLDRTPEPELTGGCRVDGTSGQPVHETLIDMCAQLDSFGAPDDLIVFANPLATASLSKQLEGKWSIVQASGTNGSKVADIGYKGWEVTLEGHQVTIITERACQKSRLWMLAPDTWTMFSAGAAPNVLQKRAGSIIKVSEFADAYDARVGEYWNLANKAPGWNCNGQLPA